MCNGIEMLCNFELLLIIFMDLTSTYFFAPYEDYSQLNIVLELLAVIFGLVSVWLSKLNNILVYPTGLISTSIYVYLLFHWGLLGDMMINGYYVAMGIYGWYYWSKKKNGLEVHKIATVTGVELRMIFALFLSTLLFVFGIYSVFSFWGSLVSYIDACTSALFFVAMFLMARRKVEHWIFWIVGDVISIPLYIYKGFALTGLQYLIFTLIAIGGYISWKKELDYERR